MRRKIALAPIITWVIAIGVGGCTTMPDPMKAKDDGTSAVYAVSEADAWGITTAVLRQEGADAIEEHKDEGYLTASAGMSLISWGTYMAVWIEPIQARETRVAIVTKRKFAIDTTVLTETTFHRRFAEEVERLHSTQDQDVEGSPPEGEEQTTVTREGLTLARGTKQTMPKSGDWLLGEWVGIREGRYRRDVTIRITSYDQATHAFQGDGISLADPPRGTIDLVIEAVVDDEGKVVMTIHGYGGRSSTFNLKRKGDDKLHGTTAYGPPSLSLEKKR